MNAFLVTFQGSLAVMLRNGFSLKHLSMATHNFELIVARALQGCLFREGRHRI